MTSARCAAIATLALAACKADRQPAERSAAPPPVEIDVAAVNALVPATLKDRLVFERRELAVDRGGHKASYTLAAPTGWVQTSKLFAHVRPPGTGVREPRLEVGDNCDGPCTAKPWEVIVDRVNFAPIARGTVRKDDHVANRRTMIAEVAAGGATTTHVVVAWWNDGEPRYHVCSAILDDAFKDAAAAFDKACQAVAIRGED
jgi:hypothetical protein